MTTKKQTLILTIVFFLLSTLLTMKQELMVDGRNEYGFPFRFWTFSYCQDIECIEELGFDIISFSLDLLLTATILFLIILAKNRISKPLIVIATLGTITSCKTGCDCNSIDKNAKDGEVLFKICKYITDNNLNSDPADPCKFEIRETINDTLNGKNILRVKLTCCYMGDEAIIDKQTNEVTGYIPSDK